MYLKILWTKEKEITVEVEAPNGQLDNLMTWLQNIIKSYAMACMVNTQTGILDPVAGDKCLEKDS